MQHDVPDAASKRLAHAAALAGLALVIVFATVFLVWRPYTVPGPPMRDLEAYYSAGATWAAGGDPYSTQIWTAERAIPGVDSSREEILPFLGPPVSLPFWAALARLPYAGAVALWSAFLAAALVAIFAGSFALAGRGMRPFDGVIVFALAAAFSPISSGFSLGQSVLAATGVFIVALLWARRGRWPGAALASFLTVLLKPNTGFALLGILRDRRGALWLAGTALLFGLANLAVIGPHGLRSYAAALRGQTAAERFSVLQLTPPSTLFGFGVSPLPANVIGSLIAFVALLLLIAAIVRTRANEVESCAMACALLPFVSPFLHEHDLVVLFLPAIYCVYRARGPAWIAGAVGMVIVAIDWLAFTQGPLGGAYSFLVAIIAALEIAAVAESIPWRLRLAPFAVAVIVAIFWIFGPRTPTPLWPSGLPAHFRVDPAASVSSVWEAEQKASGLERVDPVASAARTITLAGCALVFLSLVMTAAAQRRGRGSPAAAVLDIAPERRPELGERDPRVAANVDR